MKFNVTSQSKIFEKCNRYKVKNEFLKRCMAYNNGCDGKIAGFAWGKEDGYVFLIYFTELALGFRRHPYFADRISSSCKIRDSAFREFNNLSESEISDIVEEVRDIYKHVQTAFNSIGINSVNVTRAIGINEPYFKYKNQEYSTYGLAKLEQIRREDFSQAANLYYAKKAAEYLEIDTINCSMDILNSYGENEYSGRIQINATIDVKDILYCYELCDIAPHHLETKEWVVINRHPKGVVEIPVHSIEVNDTSDLPEPDFKDTKKAVEYLEIPIILNLPQQKMLFKGCKLEFKSVPPKKKKSFIKELLFF